MGSPLVVEFTRVMIIYKKKDWFSAIWHFHTGPTAKALIRRLIVVFIYVLIVTVVELNYVDLRLKDTPASFWGAMGILLSLLLLFRTNTAYDRFYEGRRSWGVLVNNCRNLAIYFNAVFPADDTENRLFFARTIANFPFALRNHLRDVKTLDDLEVTEEVAGNQPWKSLTTSRLGVSSQLRMRTEDLYRNGYLSNSQHINMNGYLTA